MKKAMLNRHRHVLIPLGDDFRWDGTSEADAQFDNYQKIIDYINSPQQSTFNVVVKWSTLSKYVRSIMHLRTRMCVIPKKT